MSAIFNLGRKSRTKHSSGHPSRRGEPIDMRERRHGYFPKLFVWRGHRYRVNAVERCWTVSRRNRGNRVERHCFRVRCPEGTFEVYQDVRYNTWHLQRQVA
jgi:hypothetical protein